MKILLLFACSLACFGQARWTTCYFVDNNGVETISQIPWQNCSHVVMFKAFPGTAAGVGNATVDTSYLPNLAALPAAAHTSGKQALLGLSGNDAFPAAFGQSTSPALIQRFVSNIWTMVTANGYDGVDLDWENTVDVGKYGNLISLLRARAPAGKLITMAAGNFSGLDIVAGANFAKIDQINIMCYDMDGGPPGGFSVDKTWYNDALLIGNSGISGCDWRVGAFVSAGVTYSKMGIGMPFYGRTWSGFTQALQSDVGGHGVTVLYKDLQAQANFIPANLFYDSTYQSDYLSTSSPAVWTSYTGPRTIQDIVAYQKTRGFGGFMTFALHYEFVANAATFAGKYPLSTALAKASTPTAPTTVTLTVTGGGTTTVLVMPLPVNIQVQ